MEVDWWGRKNKFPIKIYLLLPLAKPSYLNIPRTIRSIPWGLNCLMWFSLEQKAGVESRVPQAFFKLQNLTAPGRALGQPHPTLSSCT